MTGQAYALLNTQPKISLDSAEREATGNTFRWQYHTEGLLAIVTKMTRRQRTVFISEH